MALIKQNGLCKFLDTYIHTGIVLVIGEHCNPYGTALAPLLSSLPGSITN